MHARFLLVHLPSEEDRRRAFDGLFSIADRRLVLPEWNWEVLQPISHPVLGMLKKLSIFETPGKYDNDQINPTVIGEGPSLTFAELQPGRYETIFQDGFRSARLEIQPYGGLLRVRFIRGLFMKSKTGTLETHKWTILSCAPDKKVEELLHEELQFEGQ